MESLANTIDYLKENYTKEEINNALIRKGLIEENLNKLNVENALKEFVQYKEDFIEEFNNNPKNNDEDPIPMYLFDKYDEYHDVNFFDDVNKINPDTIKVILTEEHLINKYHDYRELYPRDIEGLKELENVLVEENMFKKEYIFGDKYYVSDTLYEYDQSNVQLNNVCDLRPGPGIVNYMIPSYHNGKYGYWADSSCENDNVHGNVYLGISKCKW